MTKINKLKNYFTAYNVISDDDFNGLNPETMSQPRLSVVLLLDTSSSMSGDKIKYLNEGAKAFIKDTLKDEVAASRVDIKIIQFNSTVSDVIDWQPVSNCESEVCLSATGCTSMGAALNYAFDELLAQKSKYHQLGIPAHHRQILLMVTDGEPTDDVTSAVSRIAELERVNGLQVWALAIPGANVKKLKGWFERTLVNKTADTTQFFRWMSKSMQELSKSRPGEKPQYGKLPDDVVFIEKIPDSLC